METLPITYTLFTRDNLLNKYNEVTGDTLNTEAIAEEFINNTFISKTGVLNTCVAENGAFGNIKYSYITFAECNTYIVLTTEKDNFTINIKDEAGICNTITIAKPVNTSLIKFVINSLIEYLYRERLIA